MLGFYYIELLLLISVQAITLKEHREKWTPLGGKPIYLLEHFSRFLKTCKDNCVVMGRPLNVSVLLFPHLEKEDHNSRVTWHVNELIYIKHLEQSRLSDC